MQTRAQNDHNYKITIKEAVNDFVQAELKCKENEFIDVELEHHKVPLGILGNNQEDFDDSMYALTETSAKAAAVSSLNNNNQN